MTRGCSTATCQGSPATKAVCCGQRLCAKCLDAHPCPRAAELLAMTPAQVKAWKAANEPEQALTTAMVEALNGLSEIEEAWQGKKAGIRAHDLAPGLPDVLAYARGDARLIGVETKRNHKAGCTCKSCLAQADWGARLEAAGGVYVPDVRKVQDGVDRVRMGLARARARSPAPAPQTEVQQTPDQQVG